MNEELLVTIKCTAYNHEQFIRKCLEGFVMQKTNFKFEAVVHDDASTDNTKEIIREFAEKYPNIIRPIYEKENQYSKGNLAKIMDDNVRGKYVAICEGDDYWTDPFKLQRQFDFLELHPDYVAVAENGLVLNEINNTKYLFSSEPEHDLSIGELIEKRRFPTASVMYKKEVNKDFFYYVHFPHDTTRWCWLASKGKFRYLTNVSSIYRRGNQGITEYTDKYEWAHIIEKWNLELIALFGHFFKKEIAYHGIWENYISAINDNHSLNINVIRCLMKCLKYEPIETIEHIIKKPFKIVYRKMM